MIPNNNASPSAPESNLSPPRPHVNWHEAAACTVQIELRDYVPSVIPES